MPGTISRFRQVIAAALLAVVSSAVIAAESQMIQDREQGRSGITWLSGDAIRGTFSGQTVGGLYPDGRLWSEAIKADGSTDYRETEKHWLGQWWATAREFCFAYPPPGLGGCFRVTRVSANCFELYDFSGELGKADEPPYLADLWNGRMWLSSKPTTCEERPNS